MDDKELDYLNTCLLTLFKSLNDERFEGLIPEYKLKFSKRSVRTHGSVNFNRKTIRISLPLLEQCGWSAVEQTLLHEMTHALIHEQGGQTRHSKRFWNEFASRGGVRDRFDLKPESAYIYSCPTCETEIVRMRKIKQPWRYSCMKCDKNYNPKHRLYLKRDKHQTDMCRFD